MDEDGWEDAALSMRHLHNRNDRAGSTRHEFDIRQAFGTHLVKCPALERLQPSGDRTTKATKGKKKQKDTGGSAEVVLDIFRLTDDEQGLLGSLRCPGVLEAVVVFAGSRKTLWKITRTLEQDGGASPDARRGSSAQHPADDEDEEEADSVGEDDEDNDDDDEQEAQNGIFPTSRDGKRRNRIATFEKNSFRQPKFWFRWQAVTADADDDSEGEGRGRVSKSKGKESQLHGSGYVVFSGNDCRRFQGTMTSEQLEWNNIKMNGWKARPQPERDFDIRWRRD